MVQIASSVPPTQSPSPDAGEPGTAVALAATASLPKRHAGSVVRVGLVLLKEEEARVSPLRVTMTAGQPTALCDMDAMVARLDAVVSVATERARPRR